MTQSERSFRPAMGKMWLLPLYDPLIRLLGLGRLYDRLLDEADLRAGLRVLDVGAGTGTLLIRLARRHPGSTLTGVDPDRAVLARAQRKARRAHVPITFEQGFADRLPVPDGSVDRVLSSLMVHHLDAADRPAMFAEVARVLAPGGSAHVLDFDHRDLESAEHGHRHRHRGHDRGGHDHGEPADLVALMSGAGLANARATRHGSLRRFGTYTYYRADRA